MSSLRNGGESAARRDGNAQGCECKWLVVSGAVRLHSQLTPPQKKNALPVCDVLLEQTR